MGFGKALREILRFEAIWKLICLCLVNPLLREVYQTQVAAGGLQFNTGLVWILLDPKQFCSCSFFSRRPRSYSMNTACSSTSASAAAGGSPSPWDR